MNENVFIKKNRILRGVFDAIKCAVLALALGLLFSLCVGYQYLNVISGSMSPNIPINTVVIIKKIPFNEIRVGDVVTYKVGSTNVTHRVVEIDKNNKTLSTKGDNSSNIDKNITDKMIQGVVVGQLNNFGVVVNFLTDKYNFTILIIGIILAIFLYAFY